MWNINIMINILVILILILTLYNVIENKYNILHLFLFFEIMYILLITFLVYKSLTYNIFFHNIFIILVSISTIKSVIGLTLLINYIRVYNSVYLYNI